MEDETEKEEEEEREWEPVNRHTVTATAAITTTRGTGPVPSSPGAVHAAVHAHFEQLRGGSHPSPTAARRHNPSHHLCDGDRRVYRPIDTLPVDGILMATGNRVYVCVFLRVDVLALR